MHADTTRPTGGTGIRYVRARLEESFSDRWKLHGAPVAGGWQSTVELTDELGAT